MSKFHICEGRWCYNCQKAVDMFHQCFILTENERNDMKDEKKKSQTDKQDLEEFRVVDIERDKTDKFAGYIFFDYECIVGCSDHVPNLIIAEKVCNDCLHQDTCMAGCKIFSFHNNDEFCEWLLKQDNAIAIAHNLRAYDGVFIMKYLADHPVPKDKLSIVLSGSKIITITVKKLKIIDSFNFIPMSLAKFPQTFHLTELHKGYFPHLFNTIENQNQIFNSYPAVELYGDKFMAPEEREKFHEWHKLQAGKPFDLQQELYKYCLSDVDILKKGCLKYRQILMDITRQERSDKGVDPFRSCLTLASTCHLIFRRNFMSSQTIAIIPDMGFDPSQNYSRNQMIWLKYLSFKENKRIDHCMNGREKKIANYSIDGYCRQTDTVYEYLGCFIHGCSKCYNGTTFNKLRRQSMGYIYKQHLHRKKFIEDIVTNYVEIWDHEWQDLLKKDEQVRKFVENLDLKDPIKPRDALFGGRTNAINLFHSCRDDEQIKYYDVTSLYPFVQKTCKYPKGVPIIITENFSDNIHEYFGLIQCRIIPPKGLYFPVIPARFNGKLIFTLCTKCAQQKQQTECFHNEKDRAIEGTWVSEEIKLALDFGYKVDKIFSVWHWVETEQYDPETKTGGLFTDYVNTFLQIKQENSGYPEWCKTDLDKDEYIKNYYEKEGIQLNKEKITKNEGLRSISKLLLNSMWGRYCLNTNKTQHKALYNICDLYEFLLKEDYVVNDLHILNDNVAQIFYSEKEECHLGGRDSNVVIGAFVTAYGRMKLYSEMEKLNTRVLYFDTDSIIFVSKPGDYEPHLADYLGEFTNELKPKDGNYIREFVSAGPKNYAYQLDSGKTFCKIKGFTVNFIASQKLNFHSMKELVLNKKLDEKISVEQNTFIRDKSNWSIRTEVINKLYRLVYDKRILLEDFTTLPYGF